MKTLRTVIGWAIKALHGTATFVAVLAALTFVPGFPLDQFWFFPALAVVLACSSVAMFLEKVTETKGDHP